VAGFNELTQNSLAESTSYCSRSWPVSCSIVSSMLRSCSMSSSSLRYGLCSPGAATANFSLATNVCNYTTLANNSNKKLNAGVLHVENWFFFRKFKKIISQKVLKQSLPNFTLHWTLVVPIISSWENYPTLPSFGCINDTTFHFEPMSSLTWRSRSRSPKLGHKDGVDLESIPVKFARNRARNNKVMTILSFVISALKWVCDLEK